MLKDLPEKQRILDGRIEIETCPGMWMDIEEFLDILDHGICKWSEQPAELEDKRIWLNRTEFVLKKVADRDSELKQVLMTDPSILLNNRIH